MPYQHGPNDPFLDLVFVLDCTGSMGPYIKSAKDKIREISRRIFASKLLNDPEDLRVGIVAYRDYHPQAFHEWEAKPFGFTSDMSVIEGYLSKLTATGGGDGPEALATALHKAVTESDWRRRGARVIVTITDAPPHGWKLSADRSDGFPKGDPYPKGQWYPPSQIFKLFRKEENKNIHVFTVLCEPTLTRDYKGPAVAFYKGLSNVTNGRSIPLGNAGILADSIVVFALETLDIRRILSGLGGSSISNPSHKNAKLHTLFRAVTGVQPSEAETDQQLAKLYEDAPDDLEERIEELETRRTPDEAISEIRAHLKGEVCHGCDTTVSHRLSDEGHHNMKLFMQSGATGVLQGTIKEDHGTCLVGDCDKQTVNIKKAPLSNGQIKRLAYMYTTRFAPS